MKLRGREKATIFLSILGSDTAARILRYLPEELADVIATSINHLPTPTPDALGSVLSEFKGYLSIGPARPAPAIEAKIETVEPQVEVKLEPQTPLQVLNAASGKKLSYLFSFERPQLTAFVLSRLTSEIREDVLLNLGPQKDAVTDMLKSLKPNKYTPQIEAQILEMFSKKV
ncbi:MAG: hypothetical protein HQ564_02580 [Candidatus Saganbacteria bacterium]|nr:hypothetical protein [Candidatus Saganbacteria bacterium]